MKVFKSLRRIAACAALALPATLMAQTILKASDVQPAGYPNVVALENMGKKLEAATNGKYKIQMFPGGVLGSEKEMIEQAQIGALQIARISLGPMGPVVPEVNVFNLPFLFRNEAHMRAVIDGPIGKELLDKITASSAGLVGLGWMDSGSRSMYTKNPIHTPADLKGEKIRVMGNPMFIEMMNAMGGNGISMGHNDTFSALQTGVVDGAENNPPTFFASNQYTAGPKFYSETNHLIIPELFVMSKITWNKMSKDEQALIMKLSREAQMEQRVLWDKSVGEYVGKLKAYGIKFVTVDKKPFYDATAPLRAKYGAQYPDLIKRIEAVK
ncbi:MAG: TRAP transporter substrate-binding protein [Burkholderiaceae bacterium]